ncbi:MAG: nuclear transport factor 2 family protein [Bacteroidota bacterium]
MRLLPILSLLSMLFLGVACQPSTNQAPAATSPEPNPRIAQIQQFFDHFNQHEWTQMADMYVENAEFKDPSYGPTAITQSRADIVAKYTELNAIFPDLHDEIVNIYPSGENHVIVEFISSGTAADGSGFELPICAIFTFEGDKIIKDFTYYDNFDEEEG